MTGEGILVFRVFTNEAGFFSLYSSFLLHVEMQGVGVALCKHLWVLNVIMWLWSCSDV